MTTTTSPMDRASADALMRKQYMDQQALGSGVALGATAAQLAAMAWKTEQDRVNKEELEKLQAAHAKGELAATPQTQILREQHKQGLAKVGSIQQESEQAAGAQMAATGGTTSAADIRTMREGASRPAQEAAFAVNQANTMNRLQEMGRQIAEKESRVAYKSEKAKQIRQVATQAVGDAAQIGGKVMAAQAVKKVDWGSMDLTPSEQLMYLRLFSGKGVDPYTSSMTRTAPTDTE